MPANAARISRNYMSETINIGGSQLVSRHPRRSKVYFAMVAFFIFVWLTSTAASSFPSQYHIMDDLKDFGFTPTTLTKQVPWYLWLGPTLLLYAYDKPLTDAYQQNVDAALRQNFHAVNGPFHMDHNIYWGLSALYVMNDYYKNERLRQLTYLGGEAMIDGWFVSQTLKFIIGRARPTSGESHLNWGRFDLRLFGPYSSMPSGHATVYFAFSTILGKVYEREWLGDLAGFTYYFLEVGHNHWMSDIWVGYLLGKAIGNYVWEKRVKNGDFGGWMIYPTFRNTSEGGFPYVSFWKIF